MIVPAGGEPQRLPLRPTGMGRHQLTIRASIATAATALLLAGCGTVTSTEPGAGQGDDPSGEPAVQQPDQLSGNYLAIAFSGAHEALVDGTELSLSFGDGEVRAQAGCNSLMGSYTVRAGEASADDVLVVSDMGGTEMGCGEQLMAQDEWIKEFLAADPTIDVGGAEQEKLTLTTDELSIDLMKKEFLVPEADLVGTDWRLLSLGDDDAAVSSPSSITEAASIRFAADGSYAFTICNTGSGTYELDGEQISFIGGHQTMMACQNALGDLEAEFTRLVGSESVTWSIAEDVLRLDDGAGSGLVLIAATPMPDDTDTDD